MMIKTEENPHIQLNAQRQICRFSTMHGGATNSPSQIVLLKVHSAIGQFTGNKKAQSKD